MKKKAKTTTTQFKHTHAAVSIREVASSLVLERDPQTVLEGIQPAFGSPGCKSARKKEWASPSKQVRNQSQEEHENTANLTQGSRGREEGSRA